MPLLGLAPSGGSLGGSPPPPGSPGTVTVELDVARWDVPPYQYPLGCASVNLQWGATNVTSVKVYLVGVEGTTVLITDNVEGTFPLPSGSTTKYAGTWAKDYGAGYATDQGTDATASGDSLATLADPERAGTFELLPGRSGAKLRFVVEVADDTLPFTLEYPVWHRPSGDLAAIPTTGQSSSLIYENGPHQNFGEWRYFDYLADAFLDNPSAPYPVLIGQAPTIGDYLCWRREALEGTDREDGLDAEIAALFLNGTEYTLRDHLWRDPGLELVTHAWIMAMGSPKKIVGCMVNSFSEIPPLAMLPHRDRTQYLEGDSAYCQKVWDYAFEGRRLVVEGDTLAHIVTPDGLTQWTTAATAPAGWSVSRHSHAVDGTETGYKVLYNGTHYGTVRPYHGFFSILWPPPGAAGKGLHLTAALNGLMFAVWPDDSGIGLLRFLASGASDSFRVVEEPGVNSAQVAFDPRGAVAVVYEAGGQVKRTESWSWGETWSEPVTIGSGTEPAKAVNEVNGVQAVSRWASGSHHLWISLDGGATWTDQGAIVAASEGRAGLEFSADADNPLVFVYDDAGTIKRLRSWDLGDNWT